MLRWGLGTETQFWRSVPGRGLGLAVWGQPKGLRSSVPWAGVWNAMGEGIQEKVWACRRARLDCWGEREEVGQTTIGISFPGLLQTLRGQGTSGAGTICWGYRKQGAFCAGYG